MSAAKSTGKSITGGKNTTAKIVIWLLIVLGAAEGGKVNWAMAIFFGGLAIGIWSSLPKLLKWIVAGVGVIVAYSIFVP